MSADSLEREICTARTLLVRHFVRGMLQDVRAMMLRPYRLFGS